MNSLPMKMLITVAWRNIWRNHRRTIVMISAVTVGVWAMVWMTALMRGMVDQMVKDAVAILPGHIQIHSPAYRDDPTINNSLATLPTSLQEALRDPRVLAWAPRVRLPAIIVSERESIGVSLVGIDPEAEQGLSFIGGPLAVGKHLQSPADKGLVIGKKLAERLETKLGRRVVLMSQDPANNIVDRGFRVVGIFDAELEATELAFVFTGREVAQRMLKMGEAVSEIAVSTDNYRQFDGLLSKLRDAVPDLDVRAWQKLNPYISSMMELTDGFIYVWYVVVFLAMSFGLVNTLLMAIFERTRELGLVQALGMRPGLIVVQILIESLYLLGIGLCAGNLLAWATIIPIEDGIDVSAVGQGMEWAGMSSVLYPVVETGDVVTSNIVVVVLGILTSLYPAWRAARHVPMDAISRAQ